MNWKPQIVIYHANCDDGFGAAFAAWERWGDELEYVPAHYGAPPPDLLGRDVLIADFSYKAPLMEYVRAACNSCVVLDHHVSAKDDLAGYATLCTGGISGFTESVDTLLARSDGVVAFFDMEKSGARLAWEFCHPGESVPALIRLIEDRDLWKFELEETRAFSLYLRSLPYDFDCWDDIARDLERPHSLALLMKEARGIQRYHDRLVEDVARHHDLVRFPGVDDMVPVAASPYRLASDVAHELLAKHPDAPFAATVNHRADHVGYSLRSDDGRLDVSAIAKRYGGGGHRNAAGFAVPKP